jgi:hypothetical protein
MLSIVQRRATERLAGLQQKRVAAIGNRSRVEAQHGARLEAARRRVRG